MDPDQIFRALDTDSNGAVEKEELKGFRTLCADFTYLELHERQRAPSHTYRPPYVGLPNPTRPCPAHPQGPTAADGLCKVQAAVWEAAAARG